METPKLPSPHLFKENADPVTPPRKQPRQKANTPSSAAATPLYKRFLGEVEGTEAGSRRGARSVSLDKGRRVGRVESPISNGILEIGPNGFYFSCEIPERKVARRLEDLEKDGKEGSPVRKGQGISTPTSMKKDARLMKRDVGSPGKKGVVRVGQTPMPTRKMRTPKIQRALPTRSGKLIAGRVEVLPHECLAAKTAATIENGGKKQHASEERTFGPTKSKIQSPDQGVVETMNENDDPLLGSNTVDNQNQSPHPAEEDNGHPNRSRLLNGRSRTSAPRSNGRTGPTLPASKDSQEVQPTMETRLTQIKKVSFTPQKRNNSTARKLEKPVGTPKAVRNAIEEEMRLVCQSLSNSFGSKVFVGEKGNAILLPKSASYDSPVAMKATKLCPSVEKDSQRPLQRKTERVTRTGAASESTLIASPFSQSTQTTPSKTEIKEKESHTPEGLPAKIFKSSGTNDPPSTRRLPKPKKPVFQNPVGGRRSALPLANPKHPANVSAKPGKSHYSATRTPSKEIQSALDQAIDAKIDEYKMAGREFTPSGNRVSELLEAR